MSFTTRPSLIARLPGGTNGTWSEFEALYRPLFARIAARYGLKGSDADDAVAGALADLFQAKDQVALDPAKGRFRNYLWAVTKHRLLREVRQRDRANRPPDEILNRLLQKDRADQRYSERSKDLSDLDEDDSQLKEIWEREFDGHKYRMALDRVKAVVDSKTFQAFDLYGRQGAPVREVARVLGMTEAAVFKAKSNVLKRLREIIAELDRE
jgi:RNA polymerase sigma-70 factor (ECF subfamily)